MEIRDRRGKIAERIVRVSLNVAANCVVNLYPEARAPDMPNATIRRSVEYDPAGALVIRYEVWEYLEEGSGGE